MALSGSLVRSNAILAKLDGGNLPQLTESALECSKPTFAISSDKVLISGSVSPPVRTCLWNYVILGRVELGIAFVTL